MPTQIQENKSGAERQNSGALHANVTMNAKKENEIKNLFYS